MGKIFLIIFLAVLSAGIPSAQAENYYNPTKAAAERLEAQRKLKEAIPEETVTGGGQFMTVTSVQKCYDLLETEEALDVQRNYIRPYQECKRRLSVKLQKKKSVAPADQKLDQKQEEPVEDASPNYHLVQKSPRPSSSDKAEEQQKKTKSLQREKMKLN